MTVMRWTPKEKDIVQWKQDVVECSRRIDGYLVEDQEHLAYLMEMTRHALSMLASAREKFIANKKEKLAANKKVEPKLIAEKKPEGYKTKTWGVGKKVSLLYLIGSGKKGPIKIGMSRIPRERLKALQAANPQQLFIFAIGQPQGNDRAEKVERILHKKYNNYWVHSEWFNISVAKIIEDCSGITWDIIEETSWPVDRPC